MMTFCDQKMHRTARRALRDECDNVLVACHIHHLDHLRHLGCDFASFVAYQANDDVLRSENGRSSAK